MANNYLKSGNIITVIIIVLFTSQFNYKFIIPHITKQTILYSHSTHNASKLNQTGKQSFPFHIFQIGVNKCGTTAFSKFFENNNISSAHSWPRLKMISHNNRQEPVLMDFSEKIMFYSDFEAWINFTRGNISMYKYQVLFNQYNDSKFILNIRNINDWIRSKFFHYVEKGHFFMVQCRKPIGCHKKFVKLKKKWYQHNCNVLRYFKSINETANLFIFDIDESDSIFKMVKFFDGFGLHLNVSLWAVANSRAQRIDWASNTTKSLQKERVKLWNRILLKYPQLAAQFETTESEFQRIKTFCARNK